MRRLIPLTALLAVFACGTDDDDSPDDGLGEPIEVPARTWTWVPIEGNVCRDGSPTGIGVYDNPDASRLVIYLAGGGACFSPVSCAFGNPSSAGQEGFDQNVPFFEGILATNDPANPFADSSFVYVPYCTGDVHAGSAENVDVPGPNAPRGQMFVGHDNIGRALARLVPTFSGVEQVVLTGESAGGFGAAMNFDQTARAFSDTEVILLDDSGPPMAEPNLAACLQERWRTLWNLNETLPEGCDECRGQDGGGIGNLMPYLANEYPQSRFGLISSTQDNTISLFFAFGLNECELLQTHNPPIADQQNFEEGLLAFRQTLDELPNFSTFFIDSSEHTWIGGEESFQTEVDGVTIASWASQLVEGPDVPAPAGP